MDGENNGNPIKMDDLGVPPFKGNIHILSSKQLYDEYMLSSMSRTKMVSSYQALQKFVLLTANMTKKTRKQQPNRYP